MMSILTILTTNPEKQRVAKAVFAQSNIAIEFVAFETPEIQAYTCEEVAIASAAFAYEKFLKPVAVTDAGYFIKALNGFPGPFLKYVNTMLSPEEIVRMMEGKSDRQIDLLETVVYMDDQRKPLVFTSTVRGTLALKPRGKGRLFDQLFVPDGYTQTAGELGMDKMSEIYVERFTHWRRLEEFLAVPSR